MRRRRETPAGSAYNDALTHVFYGRVRADPLLAVEARIAPPGNSP